MMATIDFQWHVVLPQMYCDDDILHEHIYILQWWLFVWTYNYCSDDCWYDSRVTAMVTLCSIIEVLQWLLVMLYELIITVGSHVVMIQKYYNDVILYEQKILKRCHFAFSYPYSRLNFPENTFILLLVFLFVAQHETLEFHRK